MEEIQQEFLKLSEDPYLSACESEDDLFSRDKAYLMSRKKDGQISNEFFVKKINPIFDDEEKYRKPW